jgi:metallo-beta-lactamase family protein
MSHMKLVRYLKQSGRPAVVIAASGMCAGGRIQNYLEALLPDNRTEIVFVGYQAQGTPGREIQKYGPRNGYVRLGGKQIDINAGVHTISGYSAHADQGNLINFVKRIRRKPSEIRIVHGDNRAKRELATKLKVVAPQARILIPKG